MKKIVTAAALIAALTFAGFQIASAHGGRYDGDNNYAPVYRNNYSNDHSGFVKENREVFDRKAKPTRIGNNFAYGHGPGMMQGYGWNSNMMRGYGWGSRGMMNSFDRSYGRHMMDW